MGFSRQGYRSGLPLPPSGDLPNPGMKSPALAGGFLKHCATWEALFSIYKYPKFLSLSVTEQDSKGPSWNRASPISSASEALFPSCFTDVKPPPTHPINERLYLMTMNTQPQGSWNPRTDNLCDITLLSHHQPIRGLHMSWTHTLPSSFLTWLLKMLCRILARNSGFF